MLYSLTISLLIEKPFYLLRSQSFSFQIVSQFIDIFVKFSNFMSQGYGLCLPVCTEGRVLKTMIVPGGRFFPLRVVSRGFVPGGGDGFG